MAFQGPAEPGNLNGGVGPWPGADPTGSCRAGPGKGCAEARGTAARGFLGVPAGRHAVPCVSQNDAAGMLDPGWPGWPSMCALPSWRHHDASRDPSVNTNESGRGLPASKRANLDLTRNQIYMPDRSICVSLRLSYATSFSSPGPAPGPRTCLSCNIVNVTSIAKRLERTSRLAYAVPAAQPVKSLSCRQIPNAFIVCSPYPSPLGMWKGEQPTSSWRNAAYCTNNTPNNNKNIS